MSNTNPEEVAAESNRIVSFEPARTDATVLLSLCKAFSDQLRLEILQILSRDSFGVLELCSIFECKQSGMSHHLKILAKAGLVVSRREGNSIFYRRAYRNLNNDAHQTLADLQHSLFSAVDHCQLPGTHIQHRVEQVQRERSVNSKAFFNENADKFHQQQEQIASYALYGPSASELIGLIYQGDRATGQALEVGPGEGSFLAELSPRFDQVYALDNSAQMLDKARQFGADQGLENVHYVLGDTGAKQIQDKRFDCVVINMVLHHVPSPAEIFSDVSTLLKPGGCLVVTDLCSHDQQWTRDSCGDFWLGFEPEDLSQWAHDAGLVSGENVFLAQRNGFRVQIRQFIKS